MFRARVRRERSEDDAWRDGARAGRDRAEAVGLGLCWVFGGRVFFCAFVWRTDLEVVVSPYVYHAEYFLVLERQVQEVVQPKEEAGEVGVDDDVPQGAQKGALLNRARDRGRFARCVCDDDENVSRIVTNVYIHSLFSLYFHRTSKLAPPARRDA